MSGIAWCPAERRRQLGLEKLRPWDLAVDPLNRPPLKPFGQVGEMVSRTQNIFNQLDPELAEHDTVVLGRTGEEPEDPRARIPAWEDIVFGVRRHR